MATKRTAKSAPAADRYTYRLAWSVKEEEFIATVVEFPSLSWIADTREGALASLTSVVEEVLQDMLAEGEEIPTPWDERTFSGKFNLRLGPDLHRRIALEAAERHESMNTYVIKHLGMIDA
ncbi:MAG: toxin-antitoxin system HicB family antitoxin [Candidatus Nanopelagicales bacterium]|nr:toxin-antitoxin system HicB family antitoxin [Candidatus Nanopelagicales bacterium]